uniref:tryptophan synthase alpha subunit n=1 Tax=Rhodochorton tenue TaxID=173034 RepID=UPI002A815D99|nr:tryptophan synthase alpha subunit [Rhodochorton tenue]WOK79561.1 tryptophan synthase alpha subunit [Rhodochorton tenue]
MTTIYQTLSSLGNKCALIPFITAGNPDLVITEKALRILDEEGADVIELGLPYSDPLADGPVIQEASKNALDGGTTLDQILQLLTSLNSSLKAPVILFTYYNPILARGVYKFLLDISQAGVKGIIIPDLPMEEADYILEICVKFSLELIMLITPVSSPQRVDKILSKSQGIIYVVSSTGVTGIRNEIKNELQHFIGNVKKKSSHQLILGFGISTKKHVKQISSWNIDGIVIGSAFVKRLLPSKNNDNLNEFRSFCSSISKVLTIDL